ncbi:hypothetical protein LVD17_06275 [Fulvivirga ulvae]|uniref:hypothetical protein n=1 Tax=Fulvivirga ulvae TaxID=2904245 RepID=UPI001F2319EB|nr:hypothetical protein [Fulvivirga ulvae]UII33427.1 hypothetical protein LVD17_06275 [Fulvivirga ulvae]
MLKFIFGPTLGYAGGFSLLSTILITITGMMSSVLLFTFLGKMLREKVLIKFFRNKKKFTKRNRRFVVIWKKYGLPGVAFLTPLLLTPIGGTILLASFGSSKREIVVSMFLSAVFWSTVFSILIYVLGPEVISVFTN